MGIVTVACPNTGEQVPTGLRVNGATIDIPGGRFRCDSCAEVHTWTKADAKVWPDSVRPSGRVPGSTGFGRTGRDPLNHR